VRDQIQKFASKTGSRDPAIPKDGIVEI
jgi:hypothetical protein